MRFGKKPKPKTKTPPIDLLMPSDELVPDDTKRGRDLAALEAMQAARPKFRPHHHVYVKGVCRLCKEPKK